MSRIRRIALQGRIGHVLDVRPPVAVTPSQIFAPAAPMRIAAGAQDFKRRGNPFARLRLGLASPLFDFDVQAFPPHLIGAVRHKGRAGIESLAQPRRRLSQRRKVWPFRHCVRRIPFVERLASAAGRIDRSQRLGVDDGNRTIQRREYRRDFARVFFARRIVVRPNQNRPARERRPIGFGCRASAAAGRCGDAVGEDSRRRFGRFLALANDYGRARIRDEIGQVEQRPMIRPSLELPAGTLAPCDRAEGLFPVRLIPARGIEGGFVLRSRVAPEACAHTAAPPRALRVRHRPAGMTALRCARLWMARFAAPLPQARQAREARRDWRRHP
jgi:hypothetical protein